MARKTITRRRVAAAIGSVCTVLLAGCSSGNSTPTDTTEPPTATPNTTPTPEDPVTVTQTQTDTDTATETPTETPAFQTEVPDDAVSDGLVETFDDYMYVVNNPEQFQGVELTFSETYYNELYSSQPQADGYKVFNMVYEDAGENGARVGIAVPNDQIDQELETGQVAYELVGEFARVYSENDRLIYFGSTDVTRL